MVPAEIADSLGLSYTAQDSSVTFTGNGISQTYTAGVPVGDTTPGHGGREAVCTFLPSGPDLRL